LRYRRSHGEPGEALERDHEELQRDVNAALAALDELRAAAERAPAAATVSTVVLAADRYVELAGRLCRRLCQHLRDEEDLVIPLLLERGDY